MGGHRAATMDRQIMTPQKKGPNLVGEREEYKKRGEQQNFKIPGQNRQLNSETKKVGDTLDRFVKNEIDQDFLKRSHLPFAAVRNKISHTQRPELASSSGFGSTNLGTGMSSKGFQRSVINAPLSPGKPVQKAEAMIIKTQSEVGNVPFSQAHRVSRINESKERNNTMTASTFAWKSPTVMM